MKTPVLDELLKHYGLESLTESFRSAVAEDMRATLATVVLQHREMAKLAGHSVKMDNSHVVREKAWTQAADWVEAFAKKEIA